MKLTTLPLAITLFTSSTAAQGGAIHKKPPPNNITPHIVKGFPWTDPFPSLKASTTVSPSCVAAKHFFAQEYTLHDLEADEPAGLKQWGPGLKNLFKQREYPGGWSGYDRHGYDRSILKMGWADVPQAVREWVQEQEKGDGEWKGLFGVFRKPGTKEDLVEDVVSLEEMGREEELVVIFAPAAIYHTLPLWAAEGSDCKDQLLDLSLYKPEPIAGNVVGWPDHKRPDLYNKAEFRVTVNVLEKKAEAEEKVATEEASEERKEEL